MQQGQCCNMCLFCRMRMSSKGQMEEKWPEDQQKNQGEIRMEHFYHRQPDFTSFTWVSFLFRFSIFHSLFYLISYVLMPFSVFSVIRPSDEMCPTWIADGQQWYTLWWQVNFLFSVHYCYNRKIFIANYHNHHVHTVDSTVICCLFFRMKMSLTDQRRIEYEEASRRTGDSRGWTRMGAAPPPN